MFEKRNEECLFHDVANADIIVSFCFLTFVILVLVFKCVRRVLTFKIDVVYVSNYATIAVIVITSVISIIANVQSGDSLEAGVEGVMLVIWLPLFVLFHLSFDKDYPENKRRFWHCFEMFLVFLSFIRDFVYAIIWGERCAKEDERLLFGVCMITRLVFTLLLLVCLVIHSKKRTSKRQIGTDSKGENGRVSGVKRHKQDQDFQEIQVEKIKLLLLDTSTATNSFSKALEEKLRQENVNIIKFEVTEDKTDQSDTPTLIVCNLAIARQDSATCDLENLKLEEHYQNTVVILLHCTTSLPPTSIIGKKKSQYPKTTFVEMGFDNSSQTPDIYDHEWNTNAMMDIKTMLTKYKM